MSMTGGRSPSSRFFSGPRPYAFVGEAKEEQMVMHVLSKMQDGGKVLGVFMKDLQFWGGSDFPYLLHAAEDIFICLGLLCGHPASSVWGDSG